MWEGWGARSRRAHHPRSQAPTIFWGLWKVVSPFIDPVSRAKVKFVHGPAGRAAMLEAVGAETLPEPYGGTAAPRLVDEAVAELPAWLQQRWGAALRDDPFVNANLDLATGGLAASPRVAPSWGD